MDATLQYAHYTLQLDAKTTRNAFLSMISYFAFEDELTDYETIRLQYYSKDVTRRRHTSERSLKSHHPTAPKLHERACNSQSHWVKEDPIRENFTVSFLNFSTFSQESTDFEFRQPRKSKTAGLAVALSLQKHHDQLNRPASEAWSSEQSRRSNNDTRNSRHGG